MLVRLPSHVNSDRAVGTGWRPHGLTLPDELKWPSAALELNGSDQS
jgi:hypothetical protein